MKVIEKGENEVSECKFCLFFSIIPFLPSNVSRERKGKCVCRREREEVRERERRSREREEVRERSLTFCEPGRKKSNLCVSRRNREIKRCD